MSVLVINSDIVNDETKVWYEWEGLNAISSQDVVDFIKNMDANDDHIDMRLHCNGGNVTEGWRIYDALRTSGKQITATIEGMCASMASVLLLAAPKERRFAYKNASLCIHNPYATGYGLEYPSHLTADKLMSESEKLRVQAEYLETEQKKIRDLYVERTGTDADTLQELMDKDTVVDMSKAIELGFITSLIEENTAHLSNPKIHNMAQANKVEVENSLFNRMLHALGFKRAEDVKFNDMVVTAADGTEITIEKESGVPAVNDHATPDGSFPLQDGTTIVIKDGVITDVIARAEALRNPETNEEIKQNDIQGCLNALFEKVKTLRGETEAHLTSIKERDEKIVTLEASVTTLNATIEDLRKQVISDEQKSILAVVDELGGVEVIKALHDTQSHGEPKGHKNDPMSHKGESDAPLAVGQAFLQELAANAPKRPFGNC